MVILTEQKQHFYFCGQIFIQLLKQYKHVAPRTEMKSACYALLSDSAELRSKFPNIRKGLNIDEMFMKALNDDNYRYTLQVIKESQINPAYFSSTGWLDYGARFYDPQLFMKLGPRT